MQLLLGLMFLLSTVEGSKNRPTVLSIGNNAGIIYERMGKVKIINDPFSIFTLVDIGMVDEVFIQYLEKVKSNVSELILAGSRYRDAIMLVPQEENESFSRLINQTQMQFTENPRALFFVNEAQRKFRSAHAELQRATITLEDTLAIAKEFDFLAEAMATIANQETPKEFFKKIDWVKIKDHLRKSFNEELLPVDQCNFIVDYKVAKLNNRTLSITLSIPTIQKDEYSLYKLHRLPSFTNVGHNNIYTRVLYNNNYLGVGNTSQRTFFYPNKKKITKSNADQKIYI